MDLITQLKLRSSNSAKLGLIKNASKLELATFEYALNPYKIYNLKFKFIDFYNLGEPTLEMFKLLDGILDGRIPRGEVARSKIQRFSESNGDLIKAICNKDLKCGIGAKTINKVFKNLIPTFDVQLAKEVPIINLTFPLTAEIKYDGVRLIIINRMGNTEFFTRNGLRINIPKLKNLLDNTPCVNYMVDNEITVLTGKQSERTKISGMVNSALKGGALRLDEIRIHAFDFMPLSDWDNKKCSHIYSDRRNALYKFLQSIKCESLVPASSLTLMDNEDANDYYNLVIEEGYEGLILKSAFHHYTFKRSADWIKVKEIKTCELLCVGFKEPNQGKLEGGIGGLICKGEIEDKEIRVVVGGLTVRDAFSPRSTFFNKVIEVKYNSIIRDSATGKWSLFLPRFSCIRFDKDL